MTSKTNGSIKRSGKLKHVQEEAPNWVIILGGALLSTLSIRFCCKLKQLFEERSRKTYTSSKENVNLTPNGYMKQVNCIHNCIALHTMKMDVTSAIQQLKEQDDMIMQMKAQITDLQNSLALQMAQTTLLLAQLDSSNHELLDSERDIQRLKKAIADDGAGESASLKEPCWLPEDANGHASGYITDSDDAELCRMC